MSVARHCPTVPLNRPPHRTRPAPIAAAPVAHDLRSPSRAWWSRQSPTNRSLLSHAVNSRRNREFSRFQADNRDVAERWRLPEHRFAPDISSLAWRTPTFLLIKGTGIKIADYREAYSAEQGGLTHYQEVSATAAGRSAGPDASRPQMEVDRGRRHVDIPVLFRIASIACISSRSRLIPPPVAHCL
jgi:hypothetical protein